MVKKIIPIAAIAFTLLVSTSACNLQERLATPACSTPEFFESINPQEKLTNQSKLTVDGVGPIKVGMSVAEASKAAGTSLVLVAGGKPNPGGSSYIVKPIGGTKEVLLQVVFDRVARVDIGDRQITTRCGAKFGDTEARIKALYPDIKVTRHKYLYAEGWHYLTLVPKDSSYSNYRIVFETDGKHVTGLRFLKSNMLKGDRLLMLVSKPSQHRRYCIPGN